MDIVYLAVIAALAAATIGLVAGCQRLQRRAAGIRR